MMRMIPALALTAALGTVACGATTSDPGAPVSTPPTSRGPVQQRQPQQPQQPQQSRQGPSEIGQSARGVIPAGQELDVRLQSSLNSGTAQAEQRFETTTVVDLTQDGVVLVPAGSQVRGVVSSAKAAGRVDRVGSMTLTFDQLSVAGRRDLPIRGMATQIFESGGIREDVGTAGIGGAAGAVVGGLIGGVKGAVLGAVIGAGGAVAATEGKDVDLPAGTVIRIRLDEPVTVR